MRTNEITLLFVAVSDGVLATWSTNAALAGAGGAAVSLSSAGNLPAAIQTLVESASRRIASLVLVADPASFQPWLTSTPASYTDLSIPTKGAREPFGIKLCASVGTAPGAYHITVKAVGDGAVYGTFLEDLTAPSPC